MTTRRGAIIATLLTPVAVFGKPQTLEELAEGTVGIARNYPITFLQLTLPEQSPEYPYDYALEVRYKDRVVKFTAEEIMDALEDNVE